MLATSTGAVVGPAPTGLLARVRTLRAVDAAAIATFATIAGVALRPVRDPDVFWHVATGRLMWRTHAIPRTDPFSWTAPGRRWIAHEWLTEAIFWPIQRTFGWAGLTVFCALSIVATWVLVWSTARRLGASPWAALGVTALGAASSTHTWDARPQMISLACMALLAWLMATAWTGRPKRLRWAVPLLLVWANLHGGYIFGIALLGAFATGATVDRMLADRYIGRRSSTAPTGELVRVAWTVTALAAVATLVNPNGVDGFLYPFSYLGDNASTRYVAEWMAPRFSNPDYWPFAVLLLVTVATLWRARRAVPAHAVICALAFGALALQSVRNISQFAVFCAPWTAWALTHMRRRAERPHRADPAKALVHAAVAVGAIAAWSVLAAPRLTAAANTAEQRTLYPVAAARYLARHANPDTRIFNQYDWGGYLTYELPGVPVFIDGRPDMYGDAFVDRYMATWLLRPQWRTRLADAGVTTVLASTTSPMVRALRAGSGWEVAYTDNVGTVLERR